MARSEPSSHREARGSWTPRPPHLRVIGPAAPHARARPAPLGSTFTDDATDRAVALGPHDGADVEAVARALPDPTSLDPGSLVVVLGDAVEAPSLSRSLRAALGRARTIPRARLCTALVARGFTRVGAGTCDKTRTDVAWGYAP